MYTITKHTKRVNGREISVFTREFSECNILKAEAGTTGYEGGDGSDTYFCIKDLGGTCMETRVFGEYGSEGFEVSLGGDSELKTTIEALKFIVQVLEDQTNE